MALTVLEIELFDKSDYLLSTHLFIFDNNLLDQNFYIPVHRYSRLFFLHIYMFSNNLNWLLIQERKEEKGIMY